MVKNDNTTCLGMVFPGILIPEYLFILAIGECGEVPGDGRSLSCFEGSDHLGVSAYRVEKVADVLLYRLGVVARERQVDFLARRHLLRSLTAQFLRIEVQRLAVQNLYGALVAHELLAIAVMIVAEVAAIVEVESTGILEDGAHGIGHLAVVLGPTEDRSGSRAGYRGGLAQDELGDVGLVYQQVGGDAARIIPIQPPLKETRLAERPFGSINEL